MATINLSPFTAEQEALDRRRKMAEALQQQAITPIEMPTVPGAKVSHLQGLGKLLQGYIAGKNLEKIEEEKKQGEQDYMSDLGFILRNYDKTETIPGSAAIPEKTTDIVEPNIKNQNQQAVAVRQLLNPNTPLGPFEKQIGVDERQAISKLPLDTVRTETTPAVAAVPERQVPLLTPDLLSPENKYIKTSRGREALVQALLANQERKIAAEQEAAKTHILPAGSSLVRNNKIILTGPKDSPVKEVTTIDKNGMPVTRYYPENVLAAMGDIPKPYTGFAADLIMAKNLPPEIMQDPQMLNLVGSRLNKDAGQVTPQDVANYMLKVAETRAKLGYEGIPFAEPAGLAAAPNPMVKPTQLKGVPSNAVGTGKFTADGKPIYQTPDGKYHVEDK